MRCDNSKSIPGLCLREIIYVIAYAHWVPVRVILESVILQVGVTLLSLVTVFCYERHIQESASVVDLDITLNVRLVQDSSLAKSSSFLLH